MLHLPQRGRRSRWVGLLFGMVLLLWFSVEDDAVWPAAALGAGLSALLAALTLMGRFGGRTIPARYALPCAAAFGALAGFGADAAAGGLMLFKNALHGHVFLDFPPGLMLAMLERAPIWTAAGGLVGVGFVLLWMALAKNG